MKLMDFGVGEEKSMPNQLILDALKNNLYDSLNIINMPIMIKHVSLIVQFLI